MLGPKHAGVDIIPETAEDIPLLAIAKGVVTRAGWLGSCGLSVDYTIEGYTVRYCHLKSFSVLPGKPVKAGQEIGIMGATGISYPKGFRHLHWVMFKDGKLIDPLSFTYTNEVTSDTYNIADEFTKIWGRKPAKGELTYFERRVARKTITDLNDLRVKLNYWKGIVYPKGIYSFTGDARWAIEKVKGV